MNEVPVYNSLLVSCLYLVTQGMTVCYVHTQYLCQISVGHLCIFFFFFSPRIAVIAAWPAGHWSPSPLPLRWAQGV